MSESSQMKGLSPLLTVDAIEPCLPFWTERLGFAVTVQVPHGEALGFAMLVRDAVTLMYQSRASVEADLEGLTGDDLNARSLLYLSVGDIDEVERALGGFEVVVPRRKTFYGATEIGYREPGGHVVVFARHEPD